MSRCAIVLTAFATLAPASAAAASPTKEALAAAKTHFEDGKRAFEAKNYQQAIEHFEAGQALVPRPLFIFNLAQAYRKLSEAGGDQPEALRTARDKYREYIDTSNLNEPERVDALRHLLELEKKLDPPAATPPPKDAPLVVAPQPAPAPAPPVAVVAPAPVRVEEQSFGSKYGLWLGLGVGVAAAAGLAVGGYFAVERARCPASIGCVDARR